MSYKDAIKAGALAFFDEKYEEDVRCLILEQNPWNYVVELMLIILMK